MWRRCGSARRTTSPSAESRRASSRASTPIRSRRAPDSSSKTPPRPPCRLRRCRRRRRAPRRTTSSPSRPRIAAQPAKISLKPGEEKMWPLVAMDVDGLSTNQIVMHYDPQAMEVADVSFGPAMKIDPMKPPIVTIDKAGGSIRITSSDGLPLRFAAGGDLAALRVRGGMTGDTYLVIDNPGLKNGRGEKVASTVSGGQAKVE